MSFSNNSFLSDNSSDRMEAKRKSWKILETKHRSSEICGWLSIPKSVVMASSLSLKHSKRLKEGKVLNISRKRYNQIKRCHEKPLIYAQSKNPQDSSEEFLDESHTEVNTLRDKFGKVSPKRSPKITRKNLESVLLRKRSFVPCCPDVQDVLMNVKNCDQTLSVRNVCNFNNLTRPLSADLILTSHCPKIQTKDQYSEVLSCSTNFKAMKSLKQKNLNSQNLKRLPGYPARVVRNSSRRSYPVCNKRPIMTTHTSWYPLSFSNDKGKLVELECDFYGYQTMAGYKDLCHSLSDGVAIVEQEFEIGDAISMQILETDRRMGLLSIGIKSFLTKKPFEKFSDVLKIEVPKNRFSATPNVNNNDDEWKFSCGISNLKAKDQLRIYRDAQGRITCNVNEKEEQLLFYFKNPEPASVAFCLGLGVTKLQLLGCQKGCENSETSKEISTKEVFEKKRCSFCDIFETGNVNVLKCPYPCGHIFLCPNCCDHIVCGLCDAPLCWPACPFCDTRLQPY